MRTTLVIDDDVLAAARAVAERDEISVGAAVSMLARMTLTRDDGGPRRNGMRTAGGRVLLGTTAELEDVLADDDAEAALLLAGR